MSTKVSINIDEIDIAGMAKVPKSLKASLTKKQVKALQRRINSQIKGQEKAEQRMGLSTVLRATKSFSAIADHVKDCGVSLPDNVRVEKAGSGDGSTGAYILSKNGQDLFSRNLLSDTPVPVVFYVYMMFLAEKVAKEHRGSESIETLTAMEVYNAALNDVRDVRKEIRKKQKTCKKAGKALKLATNTQTPERDDQIKYAFLIAATYFINPDPEIGVDVEINPDADLGEYLYPRDDHEELGAKLKKEYEGEQDPDLKEEKKKAYHNYLSMPQDLEDSLRRCDLLLSHGEVREYSLWLVCAISNIFDGVNGEKGASTKGNLHLERSRLRPLHDEIVRDLRSSLERLTPLSA